MIDFTPRIAYFPDSFHEINGVAHTSRHFEAFARRRNLPFLCVRAGDREENLIQDGNVWTLELPRGIFSFALEKDLRFDPAFPRHVPLIEETLARFSPDLIHITGPSEVGMLGAGLAHHLGLPLAASWHTNVHEYAARRADWFLRMLPKERAEATEQKIEELTLTAAAKFYSVARILFAPNRNLCKLLERTTGRECRLMPRGVDAELFHPAKRVRRTDDREFVLGFVGRLSIEKNVTQLVAIQDELERMGITNFRFLIVGHGAEQNWLRERLHRAEFPGVLRGEALSAAYASMDLFVFPSHTDTFGNVILEAMASGVPAVVTPDGGPCTIVRDGQTGRIVPDERFSAAVAEILMDPTKHEAMRNAARAYALTASWDAVFDGVYDAYETLIPQVEVLSA
ncbi:glycosyltransferase [Terracidiphilus gabretensis]|uniref:glycosyltransferase n=1 Tax=Terracidiphilus gabretensis TaxID=1577687 RepID=UPI00071C04F5|nr:glycosyltransferase [Terracidiphilus gabretensis]